MPQRTWLTIRTLLVSTVVLCSVAGGAFAQGAAGGANQVQESASTAPNPRAAAVATSPAASQQAIPAAVPPVGPSPAGATGVVAAPPAVAQPAAAPLRAAAAPTPPLPDLDTTQRTLSQLQSQARTTTDEARLVALRNETAKTEAAAEGVVSTRTTELKTTDRQLARLALLAKRHKLSAAEHTQQTQLLAKQAALEKELKQAQSVSTTASRTYNMVAERRRDSFSSQVFEQTASPVSPGFWSSLSDAAGADFDRLVFVAERAGASVVEAPEPKGLLSFVIALAVAFALVFPARKALEKLVHAKTADGTQHGFRLTAHAVWIAVVDTAMPALAAHTLHLGAQWGGLLSESADAMAGAGVLAITWGAAVVALGRATVADGAADGRLVDVPEDVASRVRFYLWMVALITGAGFLLTRLNQVVGASIEAKIAGNCVMSLAYAGVAGLVLVSFGRNRTPVDEAETTQEAVKSSGWTLFSLVLTTGDHPDRGRSADRLHHAGGADLQPDFLAQHAGSGGLPADPLRRRSLRGAVPAEGMGGAHLGGPV